MRVGERIRCIRKFRGMTLKQLGMALGNPERTADVRIAQYESGKKNPTERTIQEMALALRCKPYALRPHDHETYIGLMYTLFDLENTYGIHIDQIDGEFVLRLNRHHPSFHQVLGQFIDWYKAWEKDQSDDDPAAYTEWKINYPPAFNRKK